MSSNLRPLQRLTLYFFNRPRRTALLCLIVVLFGILSYATLLKREGFPTIETPFAVAQGTYLVNDPAKVDNDAAKPLSEFLLQQTGVDSVQTQSFSNFFIANVAYDENVNAEARSAELQKTLETQSILPKQATTKLEAFKFGFTDRGDDLVVSFYSKENTSPEILIAKAGEASDFIARQNLSLVEAVSIINPYETATNPLTGEQEFAQKSFERYGRRDGNTTTFYNSVVIGIEAKKDVDNIELDTQVKAALDELNKNSAFSGYSAEISASNAPQINAQVDELQRTLLEGLLAVLVVGSLIIAICASIVTVLSMVTVIAIVNGLLYALGYSLNTITLFAIILGLSLIVDDTIIMVEALDAQRKKQKDPAKAVSVATRKVSRAMIAATSTAALSFTPLLFVSGILGSFIRAIPVTIIAALVVSLFVALLFIPLFARLLLLGKDQMGKKSGRGFSAKVEGKIAASITKPMLWAKNSKLKLAGVSIIAFLIGTAFIGAGGYLFQKVTFNIFPSAKDTNQLSVAIVYPPNTDILTAQNIASDVENQTAEILNENFIRAAYYGRANVQSAILTIDIKDYKERDLQSPEIVNTLKEKFKQFDQATVTASQIDAGPPAAAFTARIDSSQNREAASRLAGDIASFLEMVTLERPDGSTSRIESVSPPNTSIYTRDENKQYLAVDARYEDTDTTTLVTLTQRAVEKEFVKEKLASYGLSETALSFNFGQETENQESFKNLALAFPVLLVVIYFLLAFQFRSLLQPLLIFMAIPFSLFGITLGLYLTDNAFSFFAMLGFFALIGLSIKNTILLTDYANQAQKEGMRPVDAVHEAVAERFRPLIATSLTAVVSLIPLAVTSPFWEGLAVVLIFGLLSSTFLVITVFPYYYLGVEFLRRKISRKTFGLWLVLTILLSIPLYMLATPLVIVAAAAALVAISVFKKYRHT